MIKFFRRLRQKLITEQKLSKYLLYAFGEIILVMIGILLALQVNNWNTKNSLKAKEQVYLKQIKTALEEDLTNIDSVHGFNKKKVASIDAVFMALEKYSDPKLYIPIMTIQMNIITEYDVFNPNTVAFDNMIASENINLITNLDLRNKLSVYYKKNFAEGTQERVKEITRAFTDNTGKIFFNKQTAKIVMGFDSQLPDITTVNLHADQSVYATLFTMKMAINGQNELLEDTDTEIKTILQLINSNLN